MRTPINLDFRKVQVVDALGSAFRAVLVLAFFPHGAAACFASTAPCLSFSTASGRRFTFAAAHNSKPGNLALS